MVRVNLLNGDCLDTLKDLPENSVDSIVTDPPYGLSFMGKAWDYDVPKTEIWLEAFRVLKPGGHLLSFFGTRTYHRGVVQIEDAGFEIRDCIQWLYGSGFPKSTDVSKRIYKEAGAEREVIGFNSNHRSLKETNTMVGQPHSGNGNLTSPSTDSAKQWQGWGTALKPANEPICVARKPLEKGLTVAENVLKWGCGGINIDASRIGTSDIIPSVANQNIKGAAFKSDNSEKERDTTYVQNTQGRWPANIILDEEAVMALDEQSGTLRARGNKTTKDHGGKYNASSYEFGGQESGWAGDSGGASRFFYVAKSSKRERDEGNNHPTVKPIKLMQYLIKLITPPNGTVLDPFMGSGSTGVAAKQLGFKFIGCEVSSEYMEIAKRRIESIL